MSRYVIGVDVGTGSARAALFTLTGKMLASAVEPIQTWKPRPNFVEQSSEDIWQAIKTTVHAVMKESSVSEDSVVGISFDATCSLVVLDSNDKPLTVDIEGDNQRNIIVWMDHRALAETEEINSGGYDVLRYVGGKLSPEMETPKLKWLKTHLSQTWAKAEKFFDLADFLTYHCTGDDTRSLCTVVCKWTYLGHEGEHGKWDADYFKAIGLEDLADGRKIGTKVRPMGTSLGGLKQSIAEELGLTTNCKVGVGIIDAHAGGLGLLGAIWGGDSQGKEPSTAKLETALALIGGTSNCHMAVSLKAKYIEGIWGPYFGAMVPGMWLTEGGQSSAGSAIDHVIADHSNAPALNKLAESQGVTVYQLLNDEIERLRIEAGFASPAQLTKNLHFTADFLGNRSPNADPHACAVIDGLTLDESITSQALRYYATVQAVAYGTRDIVRAMNESGYQIDTMFVTGGGTKNPLWLQEHADAAGLTLILPQEPEAVLLGSAILAAAAAGEYGDLPAAMKAMSGRGQTVRPNPEVAAYHEEKFAIYRELYQQQQDRRKRMERFN